MPEKYDDTRGPDNDTGWRKVRVGKPPNQEKVNIWVTIYASSRSMGISDSFEVPEAWRDGDNWYHVHKGKKTEIHSDYVTHWRYPRITGGSLAEIMGIGG